MINHLEMVTAEQIYLQIKEFGKAIILENVFQIRSELPDDNEEESEESIRKIIVDLHLMSSLRQDDPIPSGSVTVDLSVEVSCESTPNIKVWADDVHALRILSAIGTYIMLDLSSGLMMGEYSIIPDMGSENDEGD